jgi:arsenite-transporting ATPase
MPRSKATSTTDRRRSFSPTFRFVGGKGGVGKTTCAAALGLLEARAGRRTLIVSTDPAPSLGDALQQRLGPRPRTVKGVPHLEAVEVDATVALTAWLQERRSLLEHIALRGTWLDAEDVSQLLRLSLPGIDEIAGLLQIGDLADTGRYQHIVVDTAPTGHLLRMIRMPAVLEGLAQVFDRMQAKHRIMVDALRGGWIPDAADALIQGIDAQAGRLAALLRDPARCGVSWVTLPEPMAIDETRDGLDALGTERIAVDRIVVNRMTPEPPDPCLWCDGRRRLERSATQALQQHLRGSATIATVPAMASEPRGTRALMAVARHLSSQSAALVHRPPGRRPRRVVATLPLEVRPLQASSLVPDATALVLLGGKGGVGKTTCAAALALELAATSADRRVLLLSADPAHSLGDVLGEEVTSGPRPVRRGPANLAVRELNASEGFAALRDRFARGVEELTVRIGGSAHDRQALHDLLDLAPPGVDELVAIVEVIETLGAAAGSAAFDLIVVDTAPTGHALRLLEMPALVHDWVKAVMGILLKYQPVIGVGDLGAVLLRLSQGLGRLRALLTDAARTRFLVVTRAAALPRAETLRLFGRLQAAGIDTPIVIVNAVGAGSCGRCRREAARHHREVSALSRGLSAGRRQRPSLVLAPAIVPPPSGSRDLQAFFRSWRERGVRH